MYNSNPVRITRLKNRPKGILIPVDDYCRPPIYEDRAFKYIGASDGGGPYQKVLKEYCSICGGSIDFKPIVEPTSKYLRRRLQWFCKEHAASHGPVTPIKLKVA